MRPINLDRIVRIKKILALTALLGSSPVELTWNQAHDGLAISVCYFSPAVPSAPECEEDVTGITLVAWCDRLDRLPLPAGATEEDRQALLPGVCH